MKQILVTNDDGITAPGLLALALEMQSLGEVTIMAPDKNWSACGHVKTMHKPMRIKKVDLDPRVEAYASDGAPSDCVALGLLGALGIKFDMVVSGINPNANIGYDITYSGTVTAAMEATIAGLPGVAVSLDSPDRFTGTVDYGPAARAAKKVAAQVIERGLPKDTLISVNVPFLQDDEFKGFVVTRQGERIYHDELVTMTDPRGKSLYWIGGMPPTGVKEDGTDYGMMKAGYVSITPLTLDLSANGFADSLKAWSWA